RIGGDLIPYIGREATGIDAGAVAFAIATGAATGVTASRRRCVGIRFCYPPHDCRVVAVRLPPPDPAAGLLAAEPLAAPGETVRLPPRGYEERHAHVICT